LSLLESILEKLFDFYVVEYLLSIFFEVYLVENPLELSNLELFFELKNPFEYVLLP